MYGESTNHTGTKVFDIVFLNRRRFPDLKGNAKLKGGTKLRVPKKEVGKNAEKDRKSSTRPDGLPPVRYSGSDHVLLVWWWQSSLFNFRRCVGGCGL